MISLALFSVTNTGREAEPLIQDEQQKSSAFGFSMCTGLKFGRSYEHHVLGSEKETHSSSGLSFYFGHLLHSGSFSTKMTHPC